VFVQLSLRRRAALFLLPAALLAGCGGSDGDASTADPTPGGGSSGIAVTGAPGEKPTVEVPPEEPPAELTTEVLREGDGETVAAGDLLVADYLGQKWDGTVFDNSYDRGEPTGFSIGVGGVIPGWDKGLVGQQVGSRVLLVVPPAEGYGEQGQPAAGITGQDTLVFVVDLVQRFGKDLAASGTPAEVPAGLPQVSTTPGKAPEITLPKGAKPPAKLRSAVVIAGDGEPIDLEKTLVAQVVRLDYASGETEGTWGTAPLAVQADAVPGLAEVLEGQKVGSRVLLDIPENPEQPPTATQQPSPAQPAAAFAVDVVGMF
jgi:peptidylprolyl isomerase